MSFLSMSTEQREMTATIAGLLSAGKGILAADESVATIGKRFDALNVPCTQEVRRDYRELLFSTPGLGDFISGVILYEETLEQKTAAGDPLPRLLTDQGIIPGIKVDTGTLPLTGFPGELVTQGLDGLADRLAKYKQLGARFAKWRAVFAIGPGVPTPHAIAVNANALARYAALCQEQGLAPIVEPEVLMDGDHTLATCAAVTQEVLHAVFHALHRQRVALERMLLKPNMVVPGTHLTGQSAPEQVAAATLACLRRTVPAAVPGIVFLSGGQSEVAATANLNAVNALDLEKAHKGINRHRPRLPRERRPRGKIRYGLRPSRLSPRTHHPIAEVNQPRKPLDLSTADHHPVGVYPRLNIQPARRA